MDRLIVEFKFFLILELSSLVQELLQLPSDALYLSQHLSLSLSQILSLLQSFNIEQLNILIAIFHILIFTESEVLGVSVFVFTRILVLPLLIGSDLLFIKAHAPRDPLFLSAMDRL